MKPSYVSGGVQRPARERLGLGHSGTSWNLRNVLAFVLRQMRSY